jgi:glucokinase
MILAGDVGGTKTVLALFEPAGESLRLVRDATFASREHGSLEEILGQFLEGGPKVSLEAASFGVAGPVIDGQCRPTNLPWFLEEQALAAAAGAPRGKLLNDLEAMAYGMLFLRPDELAVLNAGAQPPRRGNVAVIAAGTGLGEAMLYWDGSRHHPMASEGGHSTFAPRTPQEIALLQHLQGQHREHVSFERVLSGPGLFNIYTFLRQTGGVPEPAWLTEKLSREDPSVTVTDTALAGTDPVCVAALELFVSIYGAEAGNLALKCLAIGGMFIGGGIAPKILSALQQPAFLEAFTAKGRLDQLLRDIPVRVALNPRTPLLGAAHFAQRL